MRRITASIAALILALTVLTACTKKPEEPKETTSVTQTETTESTTETPTKNTTAATTQTTTQSTTKKAEKEFKDWNIHDIANYFKKQKVFTNDDYLDVYDDPDSLPDGMSGQIDYNNHENDELNVLIYYFDENDKSEKSKEIYEKIKKDGYFEWDDDGGRQQPFNALVGRFAIFYSAGVNENFVKDFEKALDKLIKDNNIKPDFYEKDLDLTKYKQDDDVIIIEADD